MNQRKTGLVLEGGGMRGIYTAGVLDVFLDEKLTFDGVIGVSAGAIHGCSFVSGQKGRNIRYYKRYCNDSRFFSYRNLLLTGDMVGADFCYHEIPERLDPYDYEAFARSATEFYVGCSNLETGKPEYFQICDMRGEIDLVRASGSLPYVSRPVDWKGRKLLDGAVTDSIPILAFREMGFERCVVVLTRNKGYVKTPERVNMLKGMYRRYPAFVKALECRHLMYNDTVRTVENLEKKGEIFVIRPSEELTIGRMEHDTAKLQRTYDVGRRDALIGMRDLQKWLQSR